MLSDEDGAEERERERSSSILGLDENSEDELEDSSAVRATDGNLGIKGVPPFISKIYSFVPLPSVFFFSSLPIMAKWSPTFPKSVFFFLRDD